MEAGSNADVQRGYLLGTNVSRKEEEGAEMEGGRRNGEEGGDGETYFTISSVTGRTNTRKTEGVDGVTW